jgi:hypothetical protein
MSILLDSSAHDGPGRRTTTPVRLVGSFTPRVEGPDDVSLRAAPRTGTLGPDALGSLRGLLRRWGDGPLSGREIEEAFAPVVADARARGLYAEELLVLLKSEWQCQPVPPADGAGRNTRLSELVSACIRAFYGR